MISTEKLKHIDYREFSHNLDKEIDMKVKIFQTKGDYEEDLPKLEMAINEWMEGREIVSVNAYAHNVLSVVVVTYKEG